MCARLTHGLHIALSHVHVEYEHVIFISLHLVWSTLIVSARGLDRGNTKLLHACT